MAQVVQPTTHTFSYHSHFSPPSPSHTLGSHTTQASPSNDDGEVREDPDKGEKTLRFLNNKLLPALQAHNTRQCIGKVKAYGIDFEIELEMKTQFHLKLVEGKKTLLEWVGLKFSEISEDLAQAMLSQARLKRKQKGTMFHAVPLVTTQEPRALAHRAQQVKEDPKIKRLRERLQALLNEYKALGNYQMDAHYREIDTLEKGKREPLEVERDVARLAQRLASPEYEKLPGAIDLKKHEGLSDMLYEMRQRLDALGETIKHQMSPSLTIGEPPKVCFCHHVDLEERIGLYKIINSITPYPDELESLEKILKNALPYREDPPLTEMFNKCVRVFRRDKGGSSTTHRPGLNSAVSITSLYTSMAWTTLRLNQQQQLIAQQWK